jgi:hypothetical protein
MALKINYPWEKVKKGQGFFVPCLDTAATREEGLKRAVFLRVFDAQAKEGIQEGFTGVYFFRLPRRVV